MAIETLRTQFNPKNKHINYFRINSAIDQLTDSNTSIPQDIYEAANVYRASKMNRGEHIDHQMAKAVFKMVQLAAAITAAVWTIFFLWAPSVFTSLCLLPAYISYEGFKVASNLEEVRKDFITQLIYQRTQKTKLAQLAKGAPLAGRLLKATKWTNDFFELASFSP